MDEFVSTTIAKINSTYEPRAASLNKIVRFERGCNAAIVHGIATTKNTKKNLAGSSIAPPTYFAVSQREIKALFTTA